MVYYMLTERITEEMNIRSDELAAITAQLNAKYPASQCGSYNERVAYGMEKYHMEMYAYCKEYKALTAPIYEARKAYGLAVLTRACAPMMAKTKAVLVKECATRMKALGIQEAWVQNWVYSEGRYWYPTQSWYVYEDGGQYYFKMTKSCKATHKIEGVARMASHYDIKTTPVSPRRQQAYRIPTTWGITVATLMQEVESDRPVCICNVCGKQVSSYLSFTDDNGLEVVVGKGCLKKCAKVEGVARMDRIEIDLRTTELTMCELVAEVERRKAANPDREYVMDGDAYAIVSRERDSDANRILGG